MKAIIYEKPNSFKLENIAYPEIENPTDAVIKINLSSLGSRDVQIRQLGLLSTGKVIGREYCGTIEETGSQVLRFKTGDRVIGRPYYYCGLCYWCTRGQPQLCEYGAVFGIGETSGMQAEYARIPYADNTLVHIPHNVTDEDAVLICNVLFTGYAGITRGGFTPGDTVAIFGDGPVGLSSANCASFFGAGSVMVVGHHDYRLEFARKLGAVAMDSRSVDAVAAIKGLTDGRGADICIEAAGSDEAFQQCLKSTRKGGRVSILGTFNRTSYLNIAENSHTSFIQSVGVGESDCLRILLDLVKIGKLKPKNLITHHFSLSDSLAGYNIVENKLDEAIKVVLKC